MTYPRANPFLVKMENKSRHSISKIRLHAGPENEFLPKSVCMQDQKTDCRGNSNLMLSFDSNFENIFQNACTQEPIVFLRKQNTEFDIRL